MSKNTDQLDIAKWAVREATKAGASEARAYCDRTRYVSMDYRERKVQTLEESVTNGLNITLYIDGKYSAHRTSDLRKDAVSKFIGESVAMTKYLAADEYRRLPEEKYYEGRKNVDLDLLDGNYADVAADDRHSMARKIEAAALDAGGDKIISVEAGYYDSTTRTASVASNGFEGTSEQTSFWCGSSVTAKDEGDKRPSDWWWEGGRHKNGLGDPEEIGKRAVARTFDRVGAEKIPTEKMPFVVENRTVGRLVRWMMQGLYARNLQQKQSFLENKLGEKIASDVLTITDDPFVKRGLNSRLYDGEGISAKQLPIIEKGVLKNYYVDTYYGRKLGMEATTSGASNLVFGLGDKSQKEWMKELGRGILMTGFIGGNSNSSTGDFSVGTYGFLFENGELVKPVNELNVAGNHLEFWNNLIGMGNDPYEFSSMRAPCLVFDPMTIAGA